MPAKNSALFSRIAPSLWVFVLTFAIRLLILSRFAESDHFLPDGDDMKFYTDWALRITHGQWTDHQAFYGLPGYAYCLALIFTVTGFNPFTVGLFQIAMDAGIATLLYKLSNLLFKGMEGKSADGQAGRWIGIASAAGWAFFTPAQAFAIILMPTVWLVLAYYLCVWWAAKTELSCWWKPWLGIGVFVGAIAMLVATIFFAVPMLIAAILRSVDRGKPWKARFPQVTAAITVLVAGLFVGTSPAWIHNYFIAHEPVMLTAHSGINIWIGNNPVANGYPKMPPGIRASQDGLLKDSITLAEKAAGRKLTRVEVSKYWSAQANAYVKDNFFSWLRLMSVKLGNFWNAYQYDDLSIIKLLQDDGIVPPGLRFGFVAALGLAGFIPVVIRFPKAWWIVAAVFLHMCALLPVFVTERYRLAAAPGLIILGAGGLWVLWENLVSARWRSVAAYLAAVCGASWFASIPRADVSLWSLDYYKAGIRATSSGNSAQTNHEPDVAKQDLDRALQNLETAYAYVQTNAEINFALGNVWLAKSGMASNAGETNRDRENAVIYYHQALDLNPRHAGTLNNLGVVFTEEKRWAAAEWCFTHSLKAEPDDAKTLYLLAKTQSEEGKRADATATLAEALKLRPQQKEFLELRDQLQKPAPAPMPPGEDGKQPDSQGPAQ